MPQTRTHRQRQQQQFDFALPSEAQARRERMTALRHHWFTLIEAIEFADSELTVGQRRRVVAFLKLWLKSDHCSWMGVGTVRQTWLADELMVDRKTIARYLKWAKSVGAVEWSVDADESGCRRTTIEITVGSLAKHVGMSAMPVERIDEPDPISGEIGYGEPAPICDEIGDIEPTDQRDTVSDQRDTVSDQRDTVSDQRDTMSQHSPYPLIPSSTSRHDEEWAAVENSFKEVGVALVEDLVREARQLELSPAECGEIVETFRSNRSRFDSPGAIAFRIRRGEWPAAGVREARVIREAEQKRAADQQAAREEQRQRIAEQDQAREELLALERAYGAELDQLDEDELLRFVRSVLRDQFAFDMWRRNPGDSYVRHELLVAIHANRAGVDR